MADARKFLTSKVKGFGEDKDSTKEGMVDAMLYSLDEGMAESLEVELEDAGVEKCDECDMWDCDCESPAATSEAEPETNNEG